ncbi:recombinase family protein [Peribacillus butanolivorans]
MLKEIEAGDIVITHEISRLSRSTKDLLTIVEIIQSRGAGLKSISDSS